VREKSDLIKPGVDGIIIIEWNFGKMEVRNGIGRIGSG
jgi:hypothetical protein